LGQAKDLPNLSESPKDVKDPAISFHWSVNLILQTATDLGDKLHVAKKNSELVTGRVDEIYPLVQNLFLLGERLNNLGAKLYRRDKLMSISVRANRATTDILLKNMEWDDDSK